MLRQVEDEITCQSIASSSFDVHNTIIWEKSDIQHFLRLRLSGKKLKCLIFYGPNQTNCLKSKFLAVTLCFIISLHLQENRQIRQLQQEKQELALALEEHQSALTLIMHKYRQHTVHLLHANRVDASIAQRQVRSKVSTGHSL